MLAIDRTGRSLKPRFVVRDDRGERGAWAKEKLFKSTLAGNLDGESYGFRSDGNKRFVFTQSSSVIASAERGKRGSWAVEAGDWSGELRPASDWRSALELDSGDGVIGSVKKGKGFKLVVCELPPASQTFVAFLALAIWNSGGAEPGLAAGIGQIGN